MDGPREAVQQLVNRHFRQELEAYVEESEWCFATSCCGESIAEPIGVGRSFMTSKSHIHMSLIQLAHSIEGLSTHFALRGPIYCLHFATLR